MAAIYFIWNVFIHTVVNIRPPTDFGGGGRVFDVFVVDVLKIDVFKLDVLGGAPIFSIRKLLSVTKSKQRKRLHNCCI